MKKEFEEIKKSKYFKYIIAFGIIKKVILLILLFIPLVSFSQDITGGSTVTFKDVMSINSMESFLKVMIENNYSKIDTSTDEVQYALVPNEEGASTSFATYHTNDKFNMMFTRTGTITTDLGEQKGVVPNPYYKIYNAVKNRCKYVAVKTVGDITYATYDCNKAKFDGLIGFYASGEEGFITAFAK